MNKKLRRLQRYFPRRVRYPTRCWHTRRSHTWLRAPYYYESKKARKIRTWVEKSRIETSLFTSSIYSISCVYHYRVQLFKIDMQKSKWEPPCQICFKHLRSCIISRLIKYESIYLNWSLRDSFILWIRIVDIDMQLLSKLVVVCTLLPPSSFPRKDS